MSSTVTSKVTVSKEFEGIRVIYNVPLKIDGFKIESIDSSTIVCRMEQPGIDRITVLTIVKKGLEPIKYSGMVITDEIPTNLTLEIGESELEIFYREARKRLAESE